MSVYKKIVTSN